MHVNLANDWVIRGFDVEFALLRKEGELIQLLDPTISVIGLNVDRIRNAVIPLAVHLRKSQPKVVLAAEPVAVHVCRDNTGGYGAGAGGSPPGSIVGPSLRPSARVSSTGWPLGTQ